MKKKDYEFIGHKSITTIGITKETHNLVKNYCKKNFYKVGQWVDNALREKLDKLSHK